MSDPKTGKVPKLTWEQHIAEAYCVAEDALTSEGRGTI